MRDRNSLKRAALWAFIGSIVASAALGIWALLSGEFGDLQVRVLLSSLTVSAASLCALGGAALLEARGVRALPWSAISLACLALGLILWGMWARVRGEEYWKVTVTAGAFAVATAHLSLLRLARLAPRYRWLWAAAVVTVLGLAAYGTGLLWAEQEGQSWFRLLGVLSILVAAVTLATPVLHRLSRGEPQVRTVPEDAVEMLCPRCGARARAPLGTVDCASCGARYRVELLA